MVVSPSRFAILTEDGVEDVDDPNEKEEMEGLNKGKNEEANEKENVEEGKIEQKSRYRT